MTCKYPVNSRSYRFCLGCSDIDCCEDAVTPITSIPEVYSPKNVIPSASEANKMTNNAIDSCTTQQLAELSKLIRDAIAAVYEWFMGNMEDSEGKKEEYQISYPSTEFELVMRRKKTENI